MPDRNSREAGQACARDLRIFAATHVRWWSKIPGGIFESSLQSRLDGSKISVNIFEIFAVVCMDAAFESELKCRLDNVVAIFLRSLELRAESPRFLRTPRIVCSFYTERQSESGPARKPKRRQVRRPLHPRIIPHLKICANLRNLRIEIFNEPWSRRPRSE